MLTSWTAPHRQRHSALRCASRNTRQLPTIMSVAIELAAVMEFVCTVALVLALTPLVRLGYQSRVVAD